MRLKEESLYRIWPGWPGSTVLFWAKVRGKGWY